MSNVPDGFEIPFGDDGDDLTVNESSSSDSSSPASPSGRQAFNPASSRTRPVDPETLLGQQSRQNAQRLRQEQSEARRRLKEQTEERNAAIREDRRDRLAASRSIVTGIRSEAISQRVASYGISSVLGFPGYIGASVFDAFSIRPREEAQIVAQRQYQRDLELYNRRVAEQQRYTTRTEQDRIRNMPVMATVLGGPMGLGFPGSIPGMPSPPTPPLPPLPPSGGSIPPFIPLTPPTTPGAGGGGAGAALVVGALAAAAAIKAAQMLNQGIQNAGQQATQFGQSVTGGKPYAGLSQAAHFAKNITDPLGINFIGEVGVQGFDLLLSLTEGILESAKKDLGFMPMSLEASIQGDLQKLIQSIAIAQKTDPAVAELIRANTQIEMAWAELRASLIEVFAPEIVNVLKIIALNIRTISFGLSGGIEALKIAFPILANISAILKLIADNTSRDIANDLDNANLMTQINNFFAVVDNQGQTVRHRGVHLNPF